MHMSRFHLLPMLIMAVLTSLIFGCATLENNPTTARVAVGYATLKIIEQDSNHAERAAKINKIAQDAKRFLNGQAVTVGLLEAAVREQINPLKLSPADAFLADQLINAVIAELVKKVGTGVLDPAAVYAVNTVLDWVIDATAISAKASS